MGPKLDSVSRFSPGNCAPELLESILVGRGDLADRLEKSVLDSVETGAGHHWLLIGPRGVGKTHLLAVLYNRIEANPEIRSRVAIAYMKEEERGVATFLDWLVRILRAFRRWQVGPAEEAEALNLSEGLEALKELPLKQAQAAAERLLLRFVGDRRLVLITENLGEVFSETKGMGREGQQRFRDLVQQHPIWTIVASSQALFKDIQARGAPFYGFFKVQHLGMFDLEEAVELLRNLARLEGREELHKFLGTEIGKGRIRAIHQLTGGNPRLLVIFYQFIDRESIEDLAPPFLEMVDSLTSYYQEQMQPLPALQQKIVEFLCEQRSATTVKEIARSCFVSHQSASQQLKRLADRRYVIAKAVGRESFYELREPLFRICFEIKENLGSPIRLFVDFLGNFYSMEELKRRYRSAWLLRSIYELDGMELQEVGETEAALQCLEKATLVEPDRADVWEYRGRLLWDQGDHCRAIECFERVTTLRPGYGEGWRLLGLAQEKVGDLDSAEASYERVFELAPDHLLAWTHRIMLAARRQDRESGKRFLHNALALDAESANDFNALAEAHRALGLNEEAIECYRRALDLEPEDCYATFNIALALIESGELDAGMKQMETGAEVGEDQNWSSQLPICITEINEHLLRTVDLDRIPELLSRQQLLFEERTLRAPFIQGLTGALMGLLEKHEEVPLERLVTLREQVIGLLAHVEELSVASRLLSIGVDYLETQDVRVLLKLPREERQSLEKILTQGRRIPAVGRHGGATPALRRPPVCGGGGS